MFGPEKILTLHKVIYRNNCLDRLYLPRSEGGLGLTEVNQSFKSSMVALSQYLHASQDPYIKIVARQHIDILPQNVSVTKMGDLFAKDLIEHELEGESVQTPATDLAKQKRKYMASPQETKEKRDGLRTKEQENSQLSLISHT